MRTALRNSRTPWAAFVILICVVWLLAACGGAPGASAPTATVNSISAPTQSAPTAVPTQQVSPSDTPIPQPPTITTEVVTSVPSEPTRVQPTLPPASPTVAATQIPSQTIGIVGGTVTVEHIDVTLHDAQLSDTFTDDNGQEQTRPGFKNVLLTFGFKRLALKEGLLFNDTGGGNIELFDTDGDTYSCLYDLQQSYFAIPVGYEFRSNASCQVPVTVADSLKPFRAVVNIGVPGKLADETKAEFALGERTPNPPDIPINFEPDHVASLGQAITVDFGENNTQDDVEFTVENPRWSREPSRWIGLHVGVGEEIILIDLTITNRGKRLSPFSLILRPLDMVDRASTSRAGFPEGIETPPPGQTKTVTIPAGSMKRHEGAVPIFIQYPLKLNGTHYDYLVVETTPKQE